MRETFVLILHTQVTQTVGKQKMRVLIACEFSGAVRKEFEALGHEAWSCDLLPSEIPGNHYQGDVRDMLSEHWDLMVAHPPCTYLTISANKWYKDQPPRKSGALVGAERRAAREEAINFFMMLWNAPIERIAIENPIGVMNTLLFKPQVIQPYHFGHLESKATCFWLKNLPNLKKTNDITEEWKKLPKGEAQRLHYLSPSANRWMERSKTFPGIAQAMAQQWGSLAFQHSVYLTAFGVGMRAVNPLPGNIQAEVSPATISGR